MHIDPNRRGGFESRRIPLIIAVTLATTAVSAGLVFGHHPSAVGASTDAAAAPMALNAPVGQGDAPGDPSVPAASEAVGNSTSDSAAPASTF
jgi:hypothetical protein